MWFGSVAESATFISSVEAGARSSEILRFEVRRVDLREVFAVSTLCRSR